MTQMGGAEEISHLLVLTVVREGIRRWMGVQEKYQEDLENRGVVVLG